MNEIEGIEEEITEEEIQKQEIKELVGELQEENKEIYEIMKSTLYKTLFQALSRVTLKVEISNIENISSRPIEKIKNDPGPEEKKVKSNSSGNKSTTKKEDDFLLENVELKHETEKAYLFENVDNKVSWIPKVAMKSLDAVKKTALIHGWFVEKINWNDPKPFNQ